MSDGIHTPFVNIDQLHKNQQDKLKRRYEIYEKILVRCHNKIKNTANHPDNMGFCFFEIPRYVYGTPLFDIKGCVVYMVNSLVKNGFDVRYTHPNLLFISWRHWVPTYVRNEIKKKTGQAVDEYGNLIINNNDSNNNNNNNNDSTNINDLMFNTKNKASTSSGKEKANDYKDIKTYKPNGSLIYSNNLLKKLDINDL
jgi:hypothetical protein